MSKQKQRQSAKRQPKQHGPRQQPQRPSTRPAERSLRVLWLPGAGIVLIVAIAIAIFVLIRPSQSPPHPSPSGSAAAGLVTQLGGIPLGELDQVGPGTSTSSRFQHVSEPPLSSGGKPQLLYIGADYCPFCAGERWAMIVALSRFGSFSDVSPITSAEGGYPTFSFHGSHYTSSYLSFVGKEALDQNHNQLDALTTAESNIEQKYASGFPFLDFGNHVVFAGATFDVTVLGSLSWQQVIDALHTPRSPQAQGILGSANLLTAGICQLTGQQPANVCADPMIQDLEKQFPTG
jgi:uncharacterized protein DUF929